jgi:CheY-like chemotaxis protein
MKQVLIVDDLELMREILHEELSVLGITEILHASNIFEAKKLLNNDIDLIISDYDMPGGTGGDLLRHLYKMGIEKKFVLFTNSVHFDLPPTDHNFLGILPKMEIKKLRNLLETILHKQSSHFIDTHTK